MTDYTSGPSPSTGPSYPAQVVRRRIAVDWVLKNESAPDASAADAGPTGEISARIAYYHTPDSYGDITLPGVLEGKSVPVHLSAWGHDMTQPPVGAGMMSEDKQGLRFDGVNWLSSPAGRYAYDALKRLGPLAEFSYAFFVTKGHYGTQDGSEYYYMERIEPFEVSPVHKGASPGTETISLRAAPVAATVDHTDLYARLAGHQRRIWGVSV